MRILLLILKEINMTYDDETSTKFVKQRKTYLAKGKKLGPTGPNEIMHGFTEQYRAIPCHTGL